MSDPLPEANRVRRSPRHLREKRVGLGLAAAAAVTMLTAIVAVLALWSSDALKKPFHIVDERWFAEAMMDTWSRLTLPEDWSRATRLHGVQDYRWLDLTGRPVRIAHALGESIGPSPNSLGALERSRAMGFKLFEVDISLIDGDLRCQHDPDKLLPPKVGDCNFESLMAALPRSDAWLVLDIKTDFLATGNRIIEVLRGDGRAHQVIFQLYQPEHLAMFDAWQRTLDLPGPIVTTYLAHRALNGIAAAVADDGIRALAVPSWRMRGYTRRPPSLTLLVHPVHDCTVLRDTLQQGAQGIYTLYALSCPISGLRKRQ